MLNRDVINEAKEKWNISEEVIFIRHVANSIYHAPRSKLFIRITEASHRTQNQIESELHWMNYLHTQGIHFAHPVASSKSQFTEVINHIEGSYIVSVFKEALGVKVLQKKQFTPELFFSWGETLGQLHKHTKEYTVPYHIQKRKQWNEDEYHLAIKKYITKQEGQIFSRFQEIEDKLNLLPKAKEDFGLIHADFHTGNFHIDSSHKITLFDFDDCVYHWFAYDIATIFWSIEEHQLDWHKCEQYFFNGYNTQNVITDLTYNNLATFYEYRVILINAFCKTSLSSNKLDGNAKIWMNKTITKTAEYFSLGNRCPFFLDYH